MSYSKYKSIEEIHFSIFKQSIIIFPNKYHDVIIPVIKLTTNRLSYNKLNNSLQFYLSKINTVFIANFTYLFFYSQTVAHLYLYLLSFYYQYCIPTCCTEAHPC